MSQRKRYSSEDKVKILREHFEQKLSIPEACEKPRIHPNQFCHWENVAFFDFKGEALETLQAFEKK